MPEFPAVKFSLGFRKVVGKDIQGQIIEEVRRITSHSSRIDIGIHWLSTYINLRPSELLGIEGVDLYGGTRHSAATALRIPVFRGYEEADGPRN